MTYLVAEKFKSIQGEGLYAGTPMAFIRFVGCSVGKKVCQHCDTDFDTTYPWRGGGTFEALELSTWVGDYEHVCLTGGEPFDQADLQDFCSWQMRRPTTLSRRRMIHIETSGTLHPSWLPPMKDLLDPMWICVSPKPGFLESMIDRADEVKVIVPGLGTDESLPFSNRTNQKLHWPNISDALRWADAGKLVYLQPRNAKFDVDQHNLMLVKDLLTIHPQLRLSTQMHKILKVQ